jgi:hypothetical protein
MKKLYLLLTFLILLSCPAIGQINTGVAFDTSSTQDGVADVRLSNPAFTGTNVRFDVSGNTVTVVGTGGSGPGVDWTALKVYYLKDAVPAVVGNDSAYATSNVTALKALLSGKTNAAFVAEPSATYYFSYATADSLVIPAGCVWLQRGANLRIYGRGASKGIVIGGNHVMVDLGGGDVWLRQFSGASPLSSHGEYGCAISVGSYGTGIGYSNWVVRNGSLRTDKVGGNGLIILGNCTRFLVENITIPPSAFMGIGVALHWGNLNNIDTTNHISGYLGRIYGTQGAMVTQHPHDGTIRNIQIDSLGYGSGGVGVSLAACYDIALDMIRARRCSTAVKISAGDYGFVYQDTATGHNALAFGQGITVSRLETSLCKLGVDVSGLIDVSRLPTIFDTATVRQPVIIDNCAVHGDLTNDGYKFTYCDGVKLSNSSATNCINGIYIGSGVKNITVSWCDLYRNSTYGISVGPSLSTKYPDVVRLTGNRVWRNPSSGMYFQYAYRVYVDGNYIGDTLETGGSGQPYGIYVDNEGTGLRTYLTNNYVRAAPSSAIRVNTLANIGYWCNNTTSAATLLLSGGSSIDPSSLGSYCANFLWADSTGAGVYRQIRFLRIDSNMTFSKKGDTGIFSSTASGGGGASLWDSVTNLDRVYLLNEDGDTGVVCSDVSDTTRVSTSNANGFSFAKKVSFGDDITLDGNDILEPHGIDVDSGFMIRDADAGAFRGYLQFVGDTMFWGAVNSVGGNERIWRFRTSEITGLTTGTLGPPTISGNVEWDGNRMTLEDIDSLFMDSITALPRIRDTIVDGAEFTSFDVGVLTADELTTGDGSDNGKLQLWGNTSGSFTFTVPTIGDSIQWTMIDGDSGQVFTTDGIGTWTWEDAPAGTGSGYNEWRIHGDTGQYVDSQGDTGFGVWESSNNVYWDIGGHQSALIIGANADSVVIGPVGLSRTDSLQVVSYLMGTAGKKLTAAIMDSIVDKLGRFSPNTVGSTDSALVAQYGHVTDTASALRTYTQNYLPTDANTITDMRLTALVMSADSIIDFQGAGLSVTANVLTATLGTSIIGSEVTNQTLTSADFDTTGSNIPFDGAFHITTGVADSAYASLLYARQQRAAMRDSLIADANTFTDMRLTALVMHGDSISDFWGDGLAVASNKLTATLGTSIVSSEITDGTIASADLSATRKYAALWFVADSTAADSAAATKLYARDAAGDSILDHFDSLTTNTRIATARAGIRDTIKVVSISRTIGLMDPKNFATDTVPLLHFDSTAFAGAVTLQRLEFSSTVACTDTIYFWEWDDAVGTTPHEIDTLILTAATSVISKTFHDDSFARGSWLVATKAKSGNTILMENVTVTFIGGN